MSSPHLTRRNTPPLATYRTNLYRETLASFPLRWCYENGAGFGLGSKR
ncbi:Uncharacterised protein [Vibrio cholerae]|nr:Uncharacterised protein [Vibrio cholerae]CSI73768.1 Uncharacterised protein [Vibrio cholerae]